MIREEVDLKMGFKIQMEKNKWIDEEKRSYDLAQYYIDRVNSYDYSPPGGYMFIRENIAHFLEKRDGVKADPNSIFMTNGASTGIKMMLELLIKSPTDGIMYSIPQYPIYSALVTLFNGKSVFYYLNEEDNWNVSLEDV